MRFHFNLAITLSLVLLIFTSDIFAQCTEEVKVDISKTKNGVNVKEGDSLKLRIKGYLPDGTVFQANATSTFKVGDEGLLPGFNCALKAMKVGDKGKAFIPALQGYGLQGLKDDYDPNVYLVPPLSDLIFEIRVIKKL